MRDRIFLKFRIVSRIFSLNGASNKEQGETEHLLTIEMDTPAGEVESPRNLAAKMQIFRKHAKIMPPFLQKFEFLHAVCCSERTG